MSLPDTSEVRTQDEGSSQADPPELPLAFLSIFEGQTWQQLLCLLEIQQRCISL